MQIGANEILVIPKGSLTQMIDAMIDGVIIAKTLKLPVSMIWTHPNVQYDMLYLNNIKLVDYSYLQGKNYLYNPDPQEIKLMLNSLKKTNEQNIMVIESKALLKLDTMTILEYNIRRKSYYAELCSERMSGSLLGQINMIPFPKRPFVYNKSNKILNNAFSFKLDTSEVIISKHEVMYYLRVLAASRSDLLVCETEDELGFLLDAASVKMTPLIIRNVDPHKVREALQSKSLSELTIENFMKEDFVVFPNTLSMHLCL